METYPLYKGGVLSGRLICRQEGLYNLFRAECTDSGGEICRAYAVGEKGELLLGVMEPIQGELRLIRRLSCRETEAAGPLRSCEVRSISKEAEESWQVLDHPGSFFQNGPFQNRLRQAERALWCEDGSVRRLALPYDAHKPFPLTELFCFARIQTIHGKEWAVFAFDRQGHPTF